MIGLSEKSYGIHGTPEPSKVSKNESHGCVRLTNWNAKNLSSMVEKGTPVVFFAGQTDAMASVSKEKPTAKRSRHRNRD
jgi:hypothetical protein